MSGIKSEETLHYESDIKIESDTETTVNDYSETASQDDSATHIKDDSQTDNGNDSTDCPPTKVEESEAPVQKQRSRRNPRGREMMSLSRLGLYVQRRDHRYQLSDIPALARTQGFWTCAMRSNVSLGRTAIVTS